MHAKDFDSGPTKTRARAPADDARQGPALLAEQDLKKVAAAGSKKGASGAAGVQDNPKPKPQ